MRRLSLLLAVLCGCSPPQDDCVRQLADVNGSLNRGVGGGTGGGTGHGAVLAAVGAPITLTFFAPLTSCVSDTLRIDAVAIDPDGRSTPAMQVGALEQTVFSAVKANVTFTPTRPGLHTLKVAFEPSLGARSRFVEVAADGLSGQVIRVPIPAGATASAGLWPLTDDTVASELRSVDDITISSPAGMLTHFRGAQLVVAGQVLWSIDPLTHMLERRVFEDGGVRLTHSFPDFPALPTPALHDEDFALRYRTSGQLSTVSIWADGGFRVNDHSFYAPVDPPLAYFGTPNGSVTRWSLEECPFPCSNIEDLAAVDAQFVWRHSPLTGLTGASRTTSFQEPPLQLAHTPEALSSPPAAFERLPLWLRTQSDDRSVLVSVTDAGLHFTGWRRSEVLRVGREHVLLTDEGPGFVRVVRK
ncbi:MAG: hypothetical protein Q8N23_18750 [Archangium sp.]|nr:hypothetical protein [Archangium sp.]MDP3573615.1 hypothetical protein [Archangium sp.]